MYMYMHYIQGQLGLEATSHKVVCTFVLRLSFSAITLFETGSNTREIYRNKREAFRELTALDVLGGGTMGALQWYSGQQLQPMTLDVVCEFESYFRQRTFLHIDP